MKIQSAVQPRFAESLRPDDAFLVTFPKSGTVWLSYLIANAMCRDQGERLDLARHGFLVNVNNQYFNGGTLDGVACRLEPRLLWLHAPYDPILRKVVYMLRDPRDVLTSFWHWNRMINPQFRLSMRDFIADDNMWPCRWDRHVAGWVLSRRDPAPLVVKYEDLHRETAATLKRVLDFLNLAHTAGDIERAVAAASFERMRATEEQYKAEGRTLGVPSNGTVGDDSERFVRRGKIGGWSDEFDADTLRLLESRFGEVMRAVGYQPLT